MPRCQERDEGWDRAFFVGYTFVFFLGSFDCGWPLRFSQRPILARDDSVVGAVRPQRLKPGIIWWRLRRG
jgi:hypothetical protein